jgi:hypothetical protein
MTDLSNNFGPIYDQGAVGSCAVCSFAGVFYYELNKYNKNRSSIQHLLNNLYNIVKKYEFLEKILKKYYFPKPFFPSRYYLYYYACVNNYYKDKKDKDSNGGGTRIEYIIKIINKYGIIEELTQETEDNSYSWLYNKINDNPTIIDDSTDKTDIFIDNTSIENALYWKDKIVYECIDKNINTIKKYLAEEKPIIITTNFYTIETSNLNIKSNMSKDILDDASYIVRPKDITKGNGHAMVIVGYNDKLSAFKIRNSYGRYYGKNGYFWLDYKFFDNPTELTNIDALYILKLKI